jgi:hypothetical protein
MHRVAAGDEMASRSVAKMGPTESRRWVSGQTLRAVWRTLARLTLAADLERFPASLADPVPLLTRDTADFQIVGDLIDARDPSAVQPPESGPVAEAERDEEQEEPPAP